MPLCPRSLPLLSGILRQEKQGWCARTGKLSWRGCEGGTLVTSTLVHPSRGSTVGLDLRSSSRKKRMNYINASSLLWPISFQRIALKIVLHATRRESRIWVGMESENTRVVTPLKCILRWPDPWWVSTWTSSPAWSQSFPGYPANKSEDIQACEREIRQETATQVDLTPKPRTCLEVVWTETTVWFGAKMAFPKRFVAKA